MGENSAQRPDNRGYLRSRSLVVIAGLALLWAIGVIGEGVVRHRLGASYVRYVDAVGIPLMLGWVWSFAIADQVTRRGWARRPQVMIGAVALCAIVLAYELITRGMLPVWASGLQGGFGGLGLMLSTTFASREEREKSGDNHRGLRLALSLTVIVSAVS